MPERTNSVVTRLGLKVLRWAHSQFHGFHTYRLDLHGRPLQLMHLADGRVKITLGGRVVNKERKKDHPPR